MQEPFVFDWSAHLSTASAKLDAVSQKRMLSVATANANNTTTGRKRRKGGGSSRSHLRQRANVVGDTISRRRGSSFIQEAKVIDAYDKFFGSSSSARI